MKLRNVCIALAACLSFTVACGDNNEPADNNSAAADPGKTIYESKCTSCHGADGGPGAVSQKDLRGTSLTEAELTDKITNGVENTAMPAYEGQLTGEEIGQVVTYIQTL